jgi:hypothetical protein
MLGFDLTAVPSERQSRLLGHCYDLLMGRDEHAAFRYTKRWLLGDLFRESERRPFKLIDAGRHADGVSFVVLEKQEKRDFDQVLIIRRYRCPGPVTELMASLRLLREGETLLLVAFAETMDSDTFRTNVESRGYCILEYNVFGAETVAVKLARR